VLNISKELHTNLPHITTKDVQNNNMSCRNYSHTKCCKNIIVKNISTDGKVINN